MTTNSNASNEELETKSTRQQNIEEEEFIIKIILNQLKLFYIIY